MVSFCAAPSSRMHASSPCLALSPASRPPPFLAPPSSSLCFQCPTGSSEGWRLGLQTARPHVLLSSLSPKSYQILKAVK